jgi:uncharacterized protein YdeI (YjbR/CyaY-like superfamily)
MTPSEIPILYAQTPAHWRKWLQKNHAAQQAVWLVFYKKSSAKSSLTWSQAVDQALCFGWIDSKKVSIDAETSHQFFSKRKPNSTWSKINKLKVINLREQGLMTAAGEKCIEVAKKNGSWTLLDQVEKLIIPPDLIAELKKNPVAADFIQGLSRSLTKMILHRLVLAKRPETRQKRLQEIIEQSNKRISPLNPSR